MIKKLFSIKNIEILFILIIGLAPLLWFSYSQVILGHDAGLPIDPQNHFQDRLFAWTERYAFGSDQTYALPGFFIHGFEALVSSIGFSLFWEQKITFIFWFLIPGVTMYFLGRYLEKKFSISHLAFPATVLYMYNHFLLQGWFVAERTKFSLYAALPLLLLILFKWQEKNIGTLKSSIYISLLFFILNGMASLPLFGGIFVCLIVYVIFYFLENLTIKGLLDLLQLIIFTGIISVLLQSYWLISYADYLLGSYSQSVVFFGGFDGVISWVKYISENTSLINLLRLQGIPEWYQNPLHPYAKDYLNNVFFIGVSMVFPILAFLPLVLFKAKKIKKYVLFFSFLALFSMIFIGGSHPPFGGLYLLFIKIIPGFLAFRTPFYKFSPALWISYSILIGLSISYFTVFLKKRSVNVSYLFYFLFAVCVIFYSYPFLTGSFFDYMKNVRTMRTNLPHYVLDFSKWTQSPENSNKRILMLPAPNPDSKIEAYTWGYWSLAPLSTLYSNASIINDSHYFSDNEKMILQDMFEAIRKNDPSWTKFIKILGIDSVVVRKDFAWNLPDSPTQSPDAYIQALHKSKIKKTKSFGEWDLYTISETSGEKINSSSKVHYFDGSGKDIGKLIEVPGFDVSIPIYASSDPSDNQDKVFNASADYIIHPACLMCDLQYKYIDPAKYSSLITRDSLFYQYTKQKNSIDMNNQDMVTVFYQIYREYLQFSRLIIEDKDQQLIIDSGKDMEKMIQLAQEKLSSAISDRKLPNEYELNDLVSVMRSVQMGLAKNIKDVSGRYNDYQVFSIIQSNIDSVISAKTRLIGLIGLTSNKASKSFIVNSKISGKFDLFYKLNDQVAKSKIQIKINGVNSEISQIDPAKDWYTQKNILLSRGKNTLEVFQSSIDFYEGDREHLVVAKPSGGCFISKTISGNVGDVVKTSFLYKTIQGDQSFYVKFIKEKDKRNYLDSEDELRPAAVNIQYTNLFVLQTHEPYVLEICNRPFANPDTDFVTTLQVEDFSLIRLVSPEAFFVSQLSKGNSSTVVYERKDQTKYEVSSITGNDILILNDSYSPRWKTDFPTSIHFMANGYSNAWLVEGSKSGAVSYSPQRTVLIGFLISSVTLLVVTSYVLLRKKKK